MEALVDDFSISQSHIRMDNEPFFVGANSEIFRGRYMGQTDVALKSYSFSDGESGTSVSQFESELRLLAGLRHPSVITFYGIMRTEDGKIFLVTEFCENGSLRDLLENTSRDFMWEECISFALQVSRGLLYLHERRQPVIHRDLKSSNVFVDCDYQLKVGDFGISRYVDESSLNSTFLSVKGSPLWLAPEVMRGEGDKEPKKIDVYSFGIILWEIAYRYATGRYEPPYFDKVKTNVQTFLFGVGINGDRPDCSALKGLDEGYLALMMRCWSAAPEDRPLFAEIAERLMTMLTTGEETPMLEISEGRDRPTYIRKPFEDGYERSIVATIMEWIPLPSFVRPKKLGDDFVLHGTAERGHNETTIAYSGETQGVDERLPGAQTSKLVAQNTTSKKKTPSAKTVITKKKNMTKSSPSRGAKGTVKKKSVSRPKKTVKKKSKVPSKTKKRRIIDPTFKPTGDENEDSEDESVYLVKRTVRKRRRRLSDDENEGTKKK